MLKKCRNPTIVHRLKILTALFFTLTKHYRVVQCIFHTPWLTGNSFINLDPLHLISTGVMLWVHYKQWRHYTRANALVKKPLPWSLPCQKFCPDENLFGAYTASALVAFMIA